MDGPAVERLIRAAARLLACAVLVTGPLPAQEAPGEGPAAYREGMALLAADSLDAALLRFRAAVDADENYAPAYTGMGRAYLKLGDPDAAKDAFKGALRKAPGAVEALRGLGEAGVAREDWGEVKDAFGQVLAQRPEDLEALYWRAIAYRETGKAKGTLLRWLDWRRSERLFKRLVARAPDFRDAYYQYASLERYRGHYRRAIRLGEKQVAVKPGEARGLLRLYRHYLDNEDGEEVIAWLREQDSEYARYFVGEALRSAGRLEEADSTLQAWVDSKPQISAIPAYLSLARLYYEREEPEAAEAFFWDAVEGIRDSLDAQLVFEDVKYVVDEEEMAAFPALGSAAAYRAFFRRAWTRRDPTPAATPNARLAEHYRRMLYAEEYYLFDGFRTWFYDPDKLDNIESEYAEPFGLNDRFNDMGLIYIRHGEPSNTHKTLQPGEIWWYWKTEEFPEEMVFHFLATPSATGSNWRLVESLFGSSDLQARMRWEVERQIREAHRSAAEGFRTDRHAWEEKVDRLDHASYLAFFKGEDGQGAVELYYGMPLKKLKKLRSLADTAVAYEYGLALHDLDWREVARLHGYATRAEMEGARFEEQGIGTLRLQAPPDSCHVSFFLRPSVGRLLGIWKGDVRVPAFSETELDLSSIVPAYVVSPEGEGAEAFTSRGVYMAPNPSRRFSRKKPVYIYFEIYNLTPNEQGITSFEVEYTLTQLKREGIRRVLGIFGSREKPTTAVSVDRLGETPHSMEYLSLDLSRSGKGAFRLDIRVRDRRAGTEREGSVELVLF